MSYSDSGTGIAQYLDLRLFLEGIETPVMGCSVTANLNEPASASVQIIPDGSLSTMLPRTVVHLFYLDSDSYQMSGAASPEDKHYKLLFAGEVFSITMAKSGAGTRTANLRCLDFSNVWDTNYSYILRYAQDANQTGGAIVNNQSQFIGAGNNTDNPFDDIVSSPAEMIRNFSKSRPATPISQGLGDNCLGGLLSILELLSGVQGLYFGVNPWATVTERRSRVLESVVTDSGKVAQKLYDQQVFADWLQNKTGHAGSVISFREIIDIVLGYVYYDFVPNPVCAYTRGTDGNSRPGRDVPEYTVRSSKVPKDEIDPDTGDVVKKALTPASFNYYGASLADAGRLKKVFAAKALEVLERLEKVYDPTKFIGGENEQAVKRTALPSGWGITSSFRNVATRRRMINKKNRALGKSEVTTAQAKQIGQGYAHDNGYAMDISIKPPSNSRFVASGGEVALARPMTFGGYLPWSLDDENRSLAGLKVPDSVVGLVPRWRKFLWVMQAQTLKWPNGDDVKSGLHEGGKPKPTDSLSFSKVASLLIKTYYWTGAEPGETGSATHHPGLKFWPGSTSQEKIAAVNADYSYIKYAVRPFFTTLGRIVGEVGGLWWGGKNDKHFPPDPFWNLIGFGADPVHFGLIGWSSRRGDRPLTEGNVDEVFLKDSAAAGKRERLHAFLFRPNIWFAAPPTCNVVFPDDVENFNYNRQMMRETSRLQLDTYNQFYESAIVNKWYFAPQFAEGESLSLGGLGSVSKVFIYDHEKFSGIVPKLERISEIGFYAKTEGGRDRLTIQHDTGDPSVNSEEVRAAQGSDAHDQISRYGQQVAHFNLLTHRYSARSASWTGRFLPRLVCGFPAVFIDKPDVVGHNYNNPSLERGYWSSGAGSVHWLGMIESLTHSIDQSGARTSGNLKYVRSHKTGDDTDDLFCENITPQGTFRVQKFSGGKIKPDVGAYDFGGVWEANGDLNGDGYLVQQLVAITLRSGGLLSGVGLALQVYIDDIYEYNKADSEDTPQALDTTSVEASGEATPLARYGHVDFSKKDEGVHTGVPKARKHKFKRREIKHIVDNRGDALTKATWKGEETVVVVRWTYKIGTLGDNRQNARGAALALAILFPGEKGGPVLDTEKDNLLDRGIYPLGQALLFSDKQKTDLKKGLRAPMAQQYRMVRVGAGKEAKKIYLMTERILILPGSRLDVATTGTTTHAQRKRSIPLEESIMPPWVPDDYKNNNIGTEIYQRYFKCGSIVDIVSKSDGFEPFDNGTYSVEQAVNSLVRDYTIQSDGGRGNAIHHSRGFNRAVATYPEILYPKGWQLTQSRNEWEEMSEEDMKDPEKVKMSGGFHSAAVSGTSVKYGTKLEYLDLANKSLKTRMGSDRGTISDTAKAGEESLAERLDPRFERASRVINYLSEIEGAKALKSQGSPTGSIHTLQQVGVGRKG